jgi:hypothetical protein
MESAGARNQRSQQGQTLLTPLTLREANLLKVWDETLGARQIRQRQQPGDSEFAPGQHSPVESGPKSRLHCSAQ